MNDSGAGDSGRLVSELAARVGSLGVELADVAGNLEEVTKRVGNQAEQFKELQRAAETMVAGNRPRAP
jgi:methyl-accepting chemotaxis protein